MFNPEDTADDKRTILMMLEKWALGRYTVDKLTQSLQGYAAGSLAYCHR